MHTDKQRGGVETNRGESVAAVANIAIYEFLFISFLLTWFRRAMCRSWGAASHASRWHNLLAAVFYWLHILAQSCCQICKIYRAFAVLAHLLFPLVALNTMMVIRVGGGARKGGKHKSFFFIIFSVMKRKIYELESSERRKKIRSKIRREKSF